MDKFEQKQDIEEVRGQGIDPDAFLRDTYTQFQTWLGETRSAEGCPVNCTYCFFKLDGQTPKKPDINMSPQDTVDSITQSPTYHPEMPINFGSQTDVFSTPKTIAHYSEVLERYGESVLPNPIVFITKRLIPEKFMRVAKQVGQPVVFFMSYSGLGGTGLEPTVKDEHLRENFTRLKENDLPRVHYWRPFMPQNSSPEKITDMLAFVTQHANASAINGLKLNEGIRQHIAPFWPQIMEKDYDFQQTGDFWPEGVRPFLKSYAEEVHPDYPLFFDTACALAYAIGKPDIQGVLNSGICKESRCPPDQRVKCANAAETVSPTQVREVASDMGIRPEDVDLQDGKVMIDANVATGGLVYIRSRLRLPVISGEVNYGGHNWASNIDARDAIIEVPWTRASS